MNVPAEREWDLLDDFITCYGIHQTVNSSKITSMELHSNESVEIKRDRMKVPRKYNPKYTPICDHKYKGGILHVYSDIVQHTVLFRINTIQQNLKPKYSGDSLKYGHYSASINKSKLVC